MSVSYFDRTMAEIKAARPAPKPKPVKLQPGTWWYLGRQVFPSIDYPRSHYTQTDMQYYFVVRKNGVLGTRIHATSGPPYTVLKQCGRCQQWGTPKKTHYRSNCHEYNYSKGGNEGAMCTGCWNTVISLLRKRERLDNLRTLTKTLKRARKA